MSTPPEATRPRRIAIALSSRALPAAAATLLRHLAAARGGELHALFIEDSDLLKAVALPFAFEFCGVTSARRPIDTAALETWFRREAAAAERELAQVANACGLTCRFEILRAAPRAALVQALALLDEALLLPPPGGDGKDAAAPVIAIIDDSPAGQRALEVARAVASAEGATLEPHHLPDGTDGGANDTARVRRVQALLTRTDPRLTVIAAPLLERALATAPELYTQRGAPLLILR